MGQRSSKLAETHANVAHHFDTLEQQHEANVLGMWVFLMTEIMLFGGLFLSYTAYRTVYPEIFVEASRHQNVLLGTINTGVLIFSSLMMALAVRSARIGSRTPLVVFLLVTALFGTLFLGIKFLEYYQHYQEGLVPGIAYRYPGPHANQAALFFILYFVMTGIHAIHLTIGVGLVAVVAFRAWRGRYLGKNYTPVDLLGLYWHLVDIIWIFLFPLLYLIGLH